MHITILGGSGRMGQILVKQALSHKRTVTALVRRKGSLKPLVSVSHGLLHEIVGDATNPNDVKRAIKDSNAIIHVVSVPFFHKKPTHIYSRTTQSVIDAVQNNKNIHYVVMSNTGTHHIRQSLPRGIRQLYEYFLGDVATDKEYEEKLLAKSSISWTIIKSPFLVPGKIQHTRIIQFGSYVPGLFDNISRETIATTILDTTRQKTHMMQKVVPLIK